MTSKETNFYPKLVEEIQEQRVGAIALGGWLKHAKDNQIWLTEIGDGINTWYDFLAQPEIGLAVSEAEFLISLSELAKVFSVGEMSRVPLATARYIVKKLGQSLCHDTILDAQLLTTKDFKKRNFEESSPKKDRTYKYMVMKVCEEDGTMERVYDQDELQIAKHQITNENNG